MLHEKFLYDGWNLLGAFNGTNAAIIRSFLWGLDLSGSMQGAGGVGGLIAFRQHSGSLAGSHFAAYDGNGNVMALVDGKTGSTSARYEYDPFGQTIRASGTMATVNPVRFSSKVVDDETDYAYYGYRYLNPNAGRWLNRDPIEEAGFGNRRGTNQFQSRGNNLYCFVINNSIAKLDLFGLSERDVQTIINTFVGTMKTMCSDGRCCPEEGWRQNVYAWFTKREGCTQQSIDLFLVMYPLTQGALDDEWDADNPQDTIVPPLLYHNYVTMTPQAPQPAGPDGYIVDKITVDTWKGCYTISKRKMVFLESDPQRSFWLWKDDTMCFTCEDFKNGAKK